MSKKFLFLLTLTVSVFFLFNINSYSQDKWWKDKKYKNDAARQKHELCKKTFKEIGSGFSNNNVNSIKLYFDSQVYLNIAGNEKGYYSSNQAELILNDFMDYFRNDSFRYIHSNKYNSYAFANGIYTYISGSRKLDLKVTVSLKYYASNWYIDQISIN
ncbi:MAG: DUF4783 domain-containing protein [Ignavibacteria bacterium]|nr:DUF4783 domain-containing protein [Ignavibacteria bacterium]